MSLGALAETYEYVHLLKINLKNVTIFFMIQKLVLCTIGKNVISPMVYIHNLAKKAMYKIKYDHKNLVLTVSAPSPNNFGTFVNTRICVNHKREKVDLIGHNIFRGCQFPSRAFLVDTLSMQRSKWQTCRAHYYARKLSQVCLSV